MPNIWLGFTKRREGPEKWQFKKAPWNARVFSNTLS